MRRIPESGHRNDQVTPAEWQAIADCVTALAAVSALAW